jgi:hypothetical protein
MQSKYISEREMADIAINVLNLFSINKSFMFTVAVATQALGINLTMTQLPVEFDRRSYKAFIEIGYTKRQDLEVKLMEEFVYFVTNYWDHSGESKCIV